MLFIYSILTTCCKKSLLWKLLKNVFELILKAKIYSFNFWYSHQEHAGIQSRTISTYIANFHFLLDKKNRWDRIEIRCLCKCKFLFFSLLHNKNCIDIVYNRCHLNYSKQAIYFLRLLVYFVKICEEKIVFMGVSAECVY